MWQEKHEKISSKDISIASHQNIKERNYWLNQLAGELTKSNFPYDYHTGSSDKVNKSIEFNLDDLLFSQLMKISKGIDYTLHMILTAAAAALLGRYTGHNDIIVGMPIYRQDSSESFVNKIVALRIYLDDTMNFKDLLLQVRQTIINADQYQNYAINALIYQLSIPDSGTDFPLFDCAILLENVHDKTYLHDISLNTVFSFFRDNDNLTGKLEYNSLRYREETARQMVDHFKNLLASFLQDMNARIINVEFLTSTEKQQLLCEFNNTDIIFPIEKTIVDLFEEQVARTPDHIALLGAANAETAADHFLSYREFNVQANRLAHLLRQKGARPNTLVGLMADRTLDTMIGIAGILKAGSAYLPLDPESPIPRITTILEDAAAELILTKSNVTGLLDSLVPVSPAGTSDHLSSENPSHVNSSTDLAYSIFTSGSTGSPKGVLIEHRHLHHLAVSLKQRIYNNNYYDNYNGLAGLKVGLVSPFVFDASVKQIFAALLQGHCLCIIPEQVRTDVELLFEFYRKNCIDIADGTPAHIGMLTEAMSEKRLPPGIRRFLIGGEALTRQVVKNFYEHIPTGMPKPVFTNIYGPSECTVDTTAFDITMDNIDCLDNIPIGKPMPNSRVYILDAHGNIVPVGVTGELCIGGAGVGRGYLNDPELTAAKFNRNRSNRSYRTYILYRSGDFARWLPTGPPAGGAAKGVIEFLGRIDHQVKIRGFRIELEDIEKQLRGYKYIKDVAVIARQDQKEDKYLCAYITWNTEPKESDIPGLREYLAGQLPEYMIPGRFVRLETLPLTRNGKIDRRALPAPDSEAGTTYSPPRDRLEERLVETWAQLLGKEKDKLGIDDNFFEIGGHSLKVTILIARMHKTFNVKLPLTEIFRGPTIRELAARIRKTGLAPQEDFNAIPLVEKKEYYPLTSAMTRLYFEQQLDPESTAYNISSVAVLEGKLDKKQFINAFKELLKRHESLRTSFLVLNGQPVQKIHESEIVEFDVTYGQLNNADAPLDEIIPPFLKPFDLSRPPLMRVGLFQTGETEHVFLVNINHIVADGTSIAILGHEFMALYNNETLPLLKLQYKDFSEWKYQQVLLDQQMMEKQEQFWLKQFRGEIPVLALPYDYPRPPRKSSAGDVIETVVDEVVTQRLRALATQENATLYMLGLSLFNVLLMKLSGQEDIVVGSPNAGRTHVDLEPLIGMFVNTLPLRNQPRGNITFQAFLKEVKERTLEAFANQDYSFETLVSRVMARRDPSRSPLADVFFAVQNMERPALESPGLRMRPYEHGHFNSRFDMCFHVFEEGQELHFMMEYCTHLFKRETVEMFIKNFNEVAGQVLENPGLRLKDITISTEIQNVKIETPQVDLGF